MKEFEIFFIGNNGKLWNGFFYGRNEKEAKADAINHGIPANKIKSIQYKEEYRGYGHI